MEEKQKKKSGGEEEFRGRKLPDLIFVQLRRIEDDNRPLGEPEFYRNAQS